jgi:hypothetical protein
MLVEDRVSTQETERFSPAGNASTAEAFSRLDESDDRLFYSRNRFVSHLDSLALATVEKLIVELIVEENPQILDLMAGWDSHIPKRIAVSPYPYPHRMPSKRELSNEGKLSFNSLPL